MELELRSTRPGRRSGRRACWPVVLAAAWALAACGGGSYSTVGPPNPPPPEPPPPPPPPEPELQIVAGRDALRGRIEAAGGFRGMLVVIDNPGTTHAAAMRRAILEEGVPEDRIAMPRVPRYIIGILNFLDEPGFEDLVGRTRVVHMPFVAPLEQADEVEAIRAHNIVWVIASGNVGQRSVGDTRDFWTPHHFIWSDPEEWENHMDAFGTGKVLAATYVIREDDGSYTADRGLVKCGEARDACIAVPHPTVEGFVGATSSASARVAAMAFYVFQLVGLAEEVVDILASCAEDAGEPGVDDEFGLGVVNLACDEVEDAEVRTASESLATRRGSPALDRLLATAPEPGLSFDAGAAFADRGGRPLGRLAAAYGFGRAELALAAGRWPAPLGVSSSLSARRPGSYLAAAGRWRLAGDAGSGLYAVGSAGRAGGALSPRTARTGMLYQRSRGGATWSAYAGRAWHRAAIGIPGRREADRGRSRAAHAGWEARVVLRWKF